MQSPYENMSFDLCKKNDHSSTGTENNVYANVQDFLPTPQQHSEMKDKKKSEKIIRCALVVVLLGALAALCAMGILYHNKVISYERINQQYKNVSAALMMQENKSKGNKNRQCEEGWKSLGLKWYYFSTVKLSWTQSRDYCVEKGGHLVVITSQTEQDFVSSLIGVTHWIGLNDLETEGKWMWVNKQLLTETGVTFWYSAPEGPHEPDNWKHQDTSGEDCAALGDANGNTHKWFDASCGTMKKCICEK